MKQKNKNFLYNIVYQLFIFIIPMVITPYISRILGADNIGTYSYSYSIVYYFMLATLLGINNYGSRNIARLNKDKEKMSEEFCSIYYLQLIIGVIMLVVYNMVVLLFINNNKYIFILQNIFLISAILDINWFYFGIEKFKITISRNIIIKLFSFILIFIFVKESTDLWKYTLIMSISTLISQLYLWFLLKKYNIKMKKLSLKRIWINFKPCLILFIPVIAYSIYRVMDKTMLGAISGMTQLGYYENAEKVINIPISIITALGTVMLPYMSKIDSEDKEIFDKNISESFKLCFVFVMPMIFGLLAIAKDFSIIFFGTEFADSGNIIKLLLPTILFSSVANVIRTNYLIPKKQDRTYVISTILGAILNFVFNIILIPKYGYYGACIGTIIAEFSVMLYQVIKVKKEIDFKNILKILLNCLIKSMVMFIIIIIIGLFIKDMSYRIITQVIVACLIYFILNYKYIIHDFLGK